MIGVRARLHRREVLEWVTVTDGATGRWITAGEGIAKAVGFPTAAEELRRLDPWTMVHREDAQVVMLVRRRVLLGVGTAAIGFRTRFRAIARGTGRVVGLDGVGYRIETPVGRRVVTEWRVLDVVRPAAAHHQEFLLSVRLPRDLEESLTAADVDVDELAEVLMLRQTSHGR